MVKSNILVYGSKGWIGTQFIEILKAVGFTKAQHLPLTLGIVSLYIAIK